MVALVLGLFLAVFSISGRHALAAQASDPGTNPPTSTVCNNQDPTSLQSCLKQNPIIKDINTIVNILGGLVGILTIGSLIFAGIQYSFAGANQQAAVNARNRIISAMIAFGAFLLIFAFVQWLIPGGVFG